VNFLPSPTSRLLLAWVILLWPFWGHGQNPGTGAAVSSEAAATQPKIPEPPTTPASTPRPVPPAAPSPGQDTGPLDPLLDPSRPRNSQLTIDQEQIVPCGEISVTLPAGVYKQVLVVENPEGRRATETTELRRQQVGWGYIRYLADEKLTVGGQPRIGGLDVAIRAEDHLPTRVWYKKMTEVDDVTKAFTFILPPVGLIAGAGAWSSGNTLVPDSRPQYTEARDYFFKQPPREEPKAKPAFQSRPAEPRSTPGQRSNR
jgi:hypothetical protein